MTKLVTIVCIAFFSSAASASDYKNTFENIKNKSITTITYFISNINKEIITEDQQSKEVAIPYNKIVNGSKKAWNIFQEALTNLSTTIINLEDKVTSIKVTECSDAAHDLISTISNCIDKKVFCVSDKIHKYHSYCERYNADTNLVIDDLKSMQDAANACEGKGDYDVINSLRGINCALKTEQTASYIVQKITLAARRFNQQDSPQILENTVSSCNENICANELKYGYNDLQRCFH